MCYKTQLSLLCTNVHVCILLWFLLYRPENAPRLFDLVKTQDRDVQPAFYFALRDTLVAKDLSQASRIAYGGRVRYRVVSLEGGLIDTSGTMSGGGNRVSKGRMGSSVVVEVDPNELRNLEIKLEKVRVIKEKS